MQTPSTTPTDTAATASVSGLARSVPFWTRRVSASCRATYPPQIDAVRVPPSAWITSQSTVIWISPRVTMSHTDRRERPIRRWISWVRPDCLPLAASRVTRSPVDPGSREYSAVTQPLPLPRIHGGTRSSTDAVHSTRVRPIETRTEPGANTVKSRSNEATRSWSVARPSARPVVRRAMVPSLTAVLSLGPPVRADPMTAE